MADVYMLIGTANMQRESDRGVPPGMLKMVIDQEALDNTYEGFVNECYSGTGSVSGNQERQVVSVLEEIVNQSGETGHSFFVYDRPQALGARYRLDDNVNETAGAHAYKTQHRIGGKDVTMRTIELYVLPEEAGGC